LNELENDSNNTEEEKEKYQKVRKAIEEYEFTINLEKRIDCFIEMLLDKKNTNYKKGMIDNQNIFSNINKLPFKGYEDIKGLNTSRFWSHNSHKIKERLDKLENNPNNTNEEKEKYQKVRKAIEEYEFMTNIEKKINCFIEMLSDKKYTSYEKGKPNNQNIFSKLNKLSFKSYESIEGLDTINFWNNNSKKIKESLDKLENNPNNTNEEKEKYQKVRRAVEEYEFTTNLEKRIECFIEMLLDKKYASYEKGKPNNQNIFAQLNRIPFKGYESIKGLNIAQFWGENSTKIIQLLFYNKQYDKKSKSYIDSEKDYSTKEYDNARNAVLEYLSITDKTTYTNIEQYIDKLEQKQKKTTKVLELINLRNNLKKVLEHSKKILELRNLEEIELIKENNELRNKYLKQQEEIEIRRVM